MTTEEKQSIDKTKLFELDKTKLFKLIFFCVVVGFTLGAFGIGFMMLIIPKPGPLWFITQVVGGIIGITFVVWLIVLYAFAKIDNYLSCD